MTAERDTPAISVIVPAHDAVDTLPAQVEALSGQQTDVEFEIVVVDNGSTDGTAAWLDEVVHAHPRLRVVSANLKSSPGYARNAGAEAARAPLLAFCDADDVVDPGFVGAAVSSLASHDVVMGRLDYVALNPPWMAASRGSTSADRLGHFDGIFPYLVSACFGIRRAAFERVDGFDEELRVGQDIEFSLRLWRAGFEIAFDPDMLVHYRLRTDARSTFRQARNFGRARSVIRRRLRADGVPGVGAIKWRNAVWLVRHLPSLRHRSGRYRWLNVAGNLWGEVNGELPWSREPRRR